MSKYLTPELEPNELGLKLKSKAMPEETESVQNKPREVAPTFTEKTAEISPKAISEEKTVTQKPEKVPLPQPEVLQTAEIKQIQPSTKSRQLIDFLLLSGIIFVVIFFAVNFSAYKAIILNTLDPERQQTESANLNKAVGKKDVKQILISVDNSKKHVKKTFPPLNLSIAPVDNRIIIPAIGKNIPIVEMDAANLTGENWKELEDQIQDGLRNGVVHYPGTAIPGQVGNVFITGHSSYYPWDKGQYKEVFALLPKLNVDDVYYIFYNQKKYTYRIREKKEVNPNNVDVLNQPNDTKISTLMTCVPVGTALRRLIIVAEQI